LSPESITCIFVTSLCCTYIKYSIYIIHIYHILVDIAKIGGGRESRGEKKRGEIEWGRKREGESGGGRERKRVGVREQRQSEREREEGQRVWE
jgi:hypothetical protein